MLVDCFAVRIYWFVMMLVECFAVAVAESVKSESAKVDPVMPVQKVDLVDQSLAQVVVRRPVVEKTLADQQEQRPKVEMHRHLFQRLGQTSQCTPPPQAELEQQLAHHLVYWWW